jgi:cyclic pyranopterin monophosphate synthase
LGLNNCSGKKHFIGHSPLSSPANRKGIDRFFPDEKTSSFEAEVAVTVSGKTGIEMEAIHAVSIALITIYDMAINP